MKKRLPEKKIDIKKLKEAASAHKNVKQIAQSLGITKWSLRYLLYTKCDDADSEYTAALRKAFYEGRCIYQKNKIEQEQK